VEKQYTSALAYMKRALKLGHASAAYHLGTMYAQSLGIARNDEIALAYFEYAAKRENAAAMLNTAIIKGRNAQSDADLCVAKEWLEKASTHGIANLVSKKELHAYLQVIEGLRTLKIIRNSLKEPRFLRKPTKDEGVDAMPLGLTFEEPMSRHKDPNQEVIDPENKWAQDLHSEDVDCGSSDEEHPVDDKYTD